MADQLQGMKVAFVTANEGVEQVELTEPWHTVEEAGGRPLLVAPQAGQVQAMNHLDKADRFDVDRTTDAVSADDFDALVLPGGVANPDRLRTDQAAVALVKDLFSQGKPAAVICHGPWTLVEADLVRGRTLTSWPSVKTDIKNAGGHWVDTEVQLCEGGPNTLVTSRKPDDLPAFTSKMVEVFTGSRAAVAKG